ncbi:MAG TPA: BamA/TamA family outer membrane protein [Gemmatimonadales bacterium]|nr:BamA/TamA family outer membrane protein [Gemmatimonadales bacterium]
MRSIVALLLLALAPALHAQDSVIVIDPDAPPGDTLDRGGLPPEVLREVLRVYNDPATTRLVGDFHLPAGSRLEGRVAIFRGEGRVAGEILGPVTVINGSLTVDSGGRVAGDVLVVGGTLRVREGGTQEGGRRLYWDAAPVLRNADGDLVVRERRRPLGDLAAARTSFRAGRVRTTLLLATGRTYNRIEGLPVVFGPDIEWGASRSLQVRLRAHGILRTAGDQSSLTRDFGWNTRLELRHAGRSRLTLGVQAYNSVVPIEDQPLSRSEVGWSSFLLQRDYRDYYSVEGVGGSVSAVPVGRLRLEASLRWDREESVRANDPWSLFRNSDQWRPNPLIDDGHYLTAGLGLEYDTRNHPDFPTAGWWIRARYEHSTSDDVAPIALPATVRAPLPSDGDYAFDRVWLDLRRYARLSPGSRLNLRLRAAGWIDGDPLPIQARHSLGGSDPLPGYDFRAFTCAPSGFRDPSNPALCDRVVSLQAEFRTRLSLKLGYHYRDRERPELDRFIGIEEADLVFLGDAGKAWLTGEGPGRVPDDRIPSLKEWKADVGIGIDAGGIGAYLAKAVTDGEPVRFVLRLDRRF